MFIFKYSSKNAAFMRNGLQSSVTVLETEISPFFFFRISLDDETINCFLKMFIFSVTVFVLKSWPFLPFCFLYLRLSSWQNKGFSLSLGYQNTYLSIIHQKKALYSTIPSIIHLLVLQQLGEQSDHCLLKLSTSVFQVVNFTQCLINTHYARGTLYMYGIKINVVSLRECSIR